MSFLTQFFIEGIRLILRFIKRFDARFPGGLFNRPHNQGFPFLFVFVFFALTAVYFYPALWQPGAIIFSDLDFGFETQGYSERFTGIWNDRWGTSTLFNSSRLLFAFPFYVISFLLHHPLGLFQKMLFFATFAGAGISMTYASFVLLRNLLERQVLVLNNRLLIISSILPGLFYMLNPWFIIRFQHFYLLAGYVVLPFIISQLLVLTEQHLHTTKKTRYQEQFFAGFFSRPIFQSLTVALASFALAIAWAVGSASVHYFFIIFFIITSWVLFAVTPRIWKRDWSAVWSIVWRYVFVGVVFFFLIAYWFLPQISINVLGNVSPTNINSVDTINLLSRYISFETVLFGISYWWGFFSLDSLPRSFWIGGWILFVFTLVTVWIRLSIRPIFFLIVGYWTLFLLSLGPSGPLQSVFVWVAEPSFIADKIGFLLRDPNKLVGVMFCFFGLLFAVALGIICSHITQIVRTLDKDHASLRLQSWYAVGFVGFVVLMGGSLYLYIQPIQSLYLGHYLVPIEKPLAFTRAQEHLASSTYRYLSVPRYEDVVSPGKEFAVASWNEATPPRPSSSIDLWGFLAFTYHPLEGAYNRVKHFYTWTEHSLAFQLSDRFGDIWAALGIDTVMFHKDLQVKEHQDLEAGWYDQLREVRAHEYDFYSVKNIPREPAVGVTFSQLLLSGKNLRSLDTYARIPDLNLASTAPAFYTQASLPVFELLQGGASVLDESDAENLFLHALPDTYRVRPFDWSVRGDPFVAWAKTYTSQADWYWHTQFAGLENATFEFDTAGGLVFTRASAKLTSSPFDPPPQGERVIGMNEVSAQEDFFTVFDASQIDLKLEPTSRYDTIPAVIAQVKSGESDVWRVASSRRIPAVQRTVYRFDMTLSSLEALGLHVKVEFLDAQLQEIGVSYASAPALTTSYEALRLENSFVTPEGTRHMRFQLWSNEHPGQKTFWWLHDFNLYSLADYSAPNTISGEWTAPTSGRYEVYVRALSSWAGGTIKFDINDDTEFHTINTQREVNPLSNLQVEPYQEIMYLERGLSTRNEFVWYPVGTFDLQSGSHTLRLTNNNGFNAVSDIILVPVADYELHVDQLRSAAQSAQQIITLEGESDFDIENGNIQSRVTTPRFSLGRAVYLENGQLERDISIFADGRYDLSLFTDGVLSSAQAQIDVFVTDAQTSELIEVYEDVLGSTQKDQVVLPSIPLSAGEYTLTVKLADKTQSNILLRDMHLFHYREIIDVYNFLPYDVGRDCCYCEPLLPEDVSISYTAEDLSVLIAQGHACEWAIVASNLVPVRPGDEWLLSFDVSAEQAKHNHVKIFFLDEDRVIRDVQYITETLASFTYDWNSIQTIIDVPEDVAYVQLHLWARKNPVAIGELGMRDVLFKNYRLLPHIDLITLQEQQALLPDASSFPLDGDVAGATRIVRPPTTTAAVRGVVMYESYQPLWSLSGAPKPTIQVPLYGFLQGYVFTEAAAFSGEETVMYSIGVHQYVYQVGLLLLLFMVAVVLLRIRKLAADYQQTGK